MPDQGILGGLGNFFGSIAGSMNPALQQNQWRQQGYNYLANELGDPGEAALYMSDPNAINAAWQRQLFIQQLQSLMGPDPNNPRMPLGQALYQMSPEGQKQQYGVTPVPGFKMGDVESPGVITGGRLQAPSGFTNTPQPTQQMTAPQNAGGTNQPNATPSLGGSAGPVIPPMAQTAIDIAARKAGAIKKSEAEQSSQPGIPAAFDEADQLTSMLRAVRDDPHLSEVVGGPLGIKGRMPIQMTANGQKLVNNIATIQGGLLRNVYSSLRSAGTGRAPSPGALTELVAGTGDLNASRLGSVPDFQEEVNRIIDKINTEKHDAWVASGSPQEYKDRAAFAPESQQQQKSPSSPSKQYQINGRPVTVRQVSP